MVQTGSPPAPLRSVDARFYKATAPCLYGLRKVLMTTNSEDGADRRAHARYPVKIEVDCRSGETFLYSYIQNISEMGIFISSDEPMEIGTELDLRFEHDGVALHLPGIVTWVNPLRSDGESMNPGMGVLFSGLTAENRDRVVEIVRAIAYLRADEPN